MAIPEHSIKIKAAERRKYQLTRRRKYQYKSRGRMGD